MPSERLDALVERRQLGIDIIRPLLGFELVELDGLCRDLLLDCRDAILGDIGLVAELPLRK